MTDRTRLLALAVALLAAQPALAAGDASDGAADADGLDHATTVASSRRRRIRETPAVVTVLTRDELLASGARDLSEVLLRVPGFQLGVDVTSAVGAGFRGVWGHEGKILYLVDGIEVNDLSYGTFPLAQHVKIEQLERIEIIRGPGSALYGGSAELAVVNVTTRAATVQGAAVSATGGLVSGATSAGTLSAAAGGAAGSLRLGATASVGSGAGSDATYVDFAGDRLDLAKASAIRPATVTARLAWRDLEVRALYDDYRIDARDGYGAVVARDVTERWRTAALDARASFDVGGDVLLTPRVTYRWEQPWQARDADLPDSYYDVTNDRLTGRLSATWDSLSGPSLVAGAEAFVERGRVNDPSNGLLSYAGKSSVTNRSIAGILEAGFDSSLANFLAGARLERHSAFGTSFVPRFAATRLFGPLHAKLLASGAYRAPSIENVNYQATRIRPERTWVVEGEVGWQLSDSLYAVANVFELTVERPIVFSFDGSDVYSNEGSTGSRGAEAEVQVRLGAHSGSVSYAYYDARGKNRVAVAGRARRGARGGADLPGSLRGVARSRHARARARRRAPRRARRRSRVRAAVPGRPRAAAGQRARGLAAAPVRPGLSEGSEAVAEGDAGPRLEAALAEERREGGAESEPSARANVPVAGDGRPHDAAVRAEGLGPVAARLAGDVGEHGSGAQLEAVVPGADPEPARRHRDRQEPDVPRDRPSVDLRALQRDVPEAGAERHVAPHEALVVERVDRAVAAELEVERVVGLARCIGPRPGWRKRDTAESDGEQVTHDRPLITLGAAHARCALNPYRLPVLLRAVTEIT
jgi:outer membrane cobalamin receptor